MTRATAQLGNILNQQIGIGSIETSSDSLDSPVSSNSKDSKKRGPKKSKNTAAASESQPSQPTASARPIIDPDTGTLDGRPYLELVQWFTNGAKFTQTAWNKRFRIRGEHNQINFLIRKAVANLRFIENGMLCNRIAAKDSPDYRLVTIQSGQIIFVHDLLRDLHHKKLINLNPILQTLKHSKS